MALGAADMLTKSMYSHVSCPVVSRLASLVCLDKQAGGFSFLIRAPTHTHTLGAAGSVVAFWLLALHLGSGGYR